MRPLELAGKVKVGEGRPPRVEMECRDAPDREDVERMKVGRWVLELEREKEGCEVGGEVERVAAVPEGGRAEAAAEDDGGAAGRERGDVADVSSLSGGGRCPAGRVDSRSTGAGSSLTESRSLEGNSGLLDLDASTGPTVVGSILRPAALNERFDSPAAVAVGGETAGVDEVDTDGEGIAPANSLHRIALGLLGLLAMASPSNE